MANIYHPNEDLARIIADAWRDEDFKKKLLTPNGAKEIFASRGIHLDNPVVVTEKDHSSHKAGNNETTFVLPDPPQQFAPNSQHPGDALHTARVKMAMTALGI